MKRFSTRDPGLTLRMAIVILLGAALYLAIPALLVLLGYAEPTWSPFIVVITLVIVGATVARYRSASGLMLSATGADRVESDNERELHSLLERLAGLADVVTPSVAVVDTAVANAFSVGVRRRDATVVVTTGLQRLLTPNELEAVLGHELTHVANRDAGVMTAMAVPRTIGETMIAEEGSAFYVWFVVWWIGIPLWALGTLLTLTLSRYREFAADRGAALLTGRPADLMSALVKLSGRDTEIPDDDLRRLSTVEALCVVANGGARFSLFSDHPPLAKRLARLAEMTRAQGEPVGP